jgi:TonB family protein
VVAALAFSIALNGVALWALHRAGAFHLGSDGDTTRVALAVLATELWERNRSVAAPAPPPPARAVEGASQPRERGPEAADRPVVAVAPSADPRRPANARFLADRDNTVARDVQSRDAGKQEWKTILARPTPGPEGGPQGIPEAGDGGDAEQRVPGREGARRVERTDEEIEAAIARARLALAPPTLSPDAASPARSARPAEPAPGAGEGGSRRSGRYDPRLLPTAATFQQLAGGPSAQRLPDVEVGDETVLNTRRFKYAEFYVRLKTAFTREFDPDRAWNARDPQSLRYGRARRTTRVDVVLDREGEVLDVRVVRSSGLDFYDAEVVRAFRAAAPFPNPPLGLAAADGTIVIPSYDVAYTHPRLWPGIAGGLAPAAPVGP